MLMDKTSTLLPDRHFPSIPKFRNIAQSKSFDCCEPAMICRETATHHADFGGIKGLTGARCRVAARSRANIPTQKTR